MLVEKRPGRESEERVRLASWNISCGVFNRTGTASPPPQSSYIAKFLRVLDADIVCLQEVLFPADGPSQAAYLASKVGLHYIEWELGPSHLCTGAGMGLAILSRWPILEQHRISLPNPGLVARGADGTQFSSHNKGFLQGVIRLAGQRVLVVSGHLLPLHLFGITPDSAILDGVRRTLAEMLGRTTDKKVLIGADFNVARLSELLPEPSTSAFLKSLILSPTRPGGRQTDNILVDTCWEAEAIRVFPTRSDHHACIAELRLVSEVPSAPTQHQRKQTPTAVLHLSDLHFGPGAATDSDWKVQLQSAHHDERRDALVRLLRKLPRVPDFVVISGDLTNSCRPEGFKEFSRTMLPLIEEGYLPTPDRFIVVPGNHDVERSVDVLSPANSTRWSGFMSVVDGRFAHPWMPGAVTSSSGEIKDTALLDYAQKTMDASKHLWGGIWRGLEQRSGDRQIVSLPFVLDREREVFIYGFNSASVSQDVIRLSDDIRTDIDWLRHGTANGTSDCDKRIKRIIDVLLSSLRVDAARIDPREMEMFDQIRSKLAHEDAYCFERCLKIAVLHHHVNSIFPEEVKSFEMLLNAGWFKRQLRDAGFHVVLHGHKHWPEAFVDTSISGGGSFVVVAGGTIGGIGMEATRPGFHWIEHDHNTAAMTCRYVDLRQASGRTAGDGAIVHHFAIPATDKRVQDRATPASEPPQPNLLGLFERTERRLLENVRRSGHGAITITGWSHRLDDDFVSMVATAYGLLLIDLLELHTPQLSALRQEAVSTLLTMRQADGGWRASSQATHRSQAEATAWALLVLHRSGLNLDPEKDICALEGLLDEAVDPVLWQHTYCLCLVLRVLAEVSPASPYVALLSQTLLDCAARDENGFPVFWSRRTDRNPEELSSQRLMTPSVLHTAHALLTLLDVGRATRGLLGLPASSLRCACDWLLKQPAWEDTEEMLRRPSLGSSHSASVTLSVGHFTAPWVVTAALACGVDRSNPRIAAEITKLLASEDDGLWNWGPIRHPVWATYDALHALKIFALRGSSTSQRPDN